MSIVRQTFGGGGVGMAHTPTTSYRRRKGYAATRVAYDRRRRLNEKTSADREWEATLRRDPCAMSFLGGCHPQMAVDHIVPLDGGGEDAASNQTALCRAHNAAKKNEKLLLFLAGRPR